MKLQRRYAVSISSKQVKWRHLYLTSASQIWVILVSYLLFIESITTRYSYSTTIHHRTIKPQNGVSFAHKHEQLSKSYLIQRPPLGATATHLPTRTWVAAWSSGTSPSPRSRIRATPLWGSTRSLQTSQFRPQLSNRGSFQGNGTRSTPRNPKSDRSLGTRSQLRIPPQREHSCNGHWHALWPKQPRDNHIWSHRGRTFW